MIYRLAVLALALVYFGTFDIQAAELAAGPMVGATAQRSARIWFQTTAQGTASVEYWSDKLPTATRRTEPVKTNAAHQNAATIAVNDLKPGTRYSYRVLLDGRPASPVLGFNTQTLWQWRTDPPEIRVVTGSCAYINQPEFDRPGTPYGAGEEIFDRMAEAKPDLTVWLGDNLYFREADFDSPWGMEARYANTRQSKPLQKLFRTGAHAAIWDDHDYGANDSNSSFILKDKSLELFKTYWPNPSYGLPEMPGVFNHRTSGGRRIFPDRWALVPRL